MAYSGYLIKVGGSNGTPLPFKYMKASGYSITPNQRMESEAKRSVDGVLHRSTVEHTATKIEFNTPNMTNTDVNDMMTLFKNNWTSAAERKLLLYYYDIESDAYKEGTFYMPDIQFPIVRVDNVKNVVYYGETRIAFIEY